MTDIMPEFIFTNATKVATLANGDKIVFALFSEEHYDRLRLCSDEEIIKMDKIAFTNIGLPQFIGFKILDVTDRFPELSGGITVDETFISHIQQTMWSSQQHGATAGYFVVPSIGHEKFRLTMKSNKILDSEVLKLKPEYRIVKIWMDKIVEAKEIEIREIEKVEEIIIDIAK